MGDIIPFRKPSPAEKHKGNTLCRRGYHQWEPLPATPFDVKHGKLVTRYRCRRCGAVRIKGS